MRVSKCEFLGKMRFSKCEFFDKLSSSKGEFGEFRNVNFGISNNHEFSKPI